MDQPKDPATTETRPSMSPDVRISVTDFGPIAEGTIDLRPLTVFVGPSNTGKTYFAILIYALDRALGGFTRFPKYSTIYRRDDQSADNAIQEEEIRKIQEKLESEEQSLRFSDLPGNMRKAVQSYLNHPDKLGTHLKTQLLRCFDLESVDDLNLSFGTSRGMNISLSINEKDQALWGFNAGTSQADITTSGQIEDIPLLREVETGVGLEYDPELRGLFSNVLDSEISKRIYRERQSDTELEHHPVSPGLSKLLGLDISRLSRWDYFIGPRLSNYPIRNSAISSTYYLPAARSGIMQSHRVIASSLVARAVRAGFERFELPTFSGVMADFMERLILYGEGRKRPPLDSSWPALAILAHAMDQKDDKLNERVNEIADILEQKVLTGQIRTREASPSAYPEFVYRALETAQDIRLSRASSMVSELAPVVLFLRDAVNHGDTLIIEEPEAHLHPAAQTQMAVALARLVRAGVRVVITTHSDWLLQEIGNLIREGELEEQTGEPASEGDLPSSLRPSEVGIWLFRRDGDSTGSTVQEIPFDRREGVEPGEYEDVAEALYNRSANLQDRLEETAGEPKRGDE